MDTTNVDVNVCMSLPYVYASMYLLSLSLRIPGSSDTPPKAMSFPSVQTLTSVG